MAEETYITDPALQDYEGDGATRPADPAAARSQIEMTRARMSETIDEIEDALLRKKARLQTRLDVTAPVREKPMASAAAALAAGLLLGLLTGGSDEDADPAHLDRDERLSEAEERARTWEARARRLMRVAREQEAALEESAEHDGLEWDMDDSEVVDDVGRIRDRIAGGVTGFVSDMAREIFAGGRR